MEGVNLWCKSVVAVSVISSLISLIVHEGSVKKSFNTLMSIMLIFMFVYPVNGDKEDFLSLADKFDFTDSERSEEEIENYSESAIITVAESEIRKHIENIIVDCECEATCEYESDTLKIVSINIKGEFDTVSKREYYTEIKKICTSDTVVKFNGEKYE